MATDTLYVREKAILIFNAGHFTIILYHENGSASVHHCVCIIMHFGRILNCAQIYYMMSLIGNQLVYVEYTLVFYNNLMHTPYSTCITISYLFSQENRLIGERRQLQISTKTALTLIPKQTSCELDWINLVSIQPR